MKQIFPNMKNDKLLYMVITFQPSKCDLVDWSDEAAQEKDLLLEIFFEWGKRVCATLSGMGHWADLSDPCSGYPVIGERGGMAYVETLGAELLLPYERIQVGGCEVVSHPRWRTAAYPATLFTTAPLECLYEALGQSEHQYHHANEVPS